MASDKVFIVGGVSEIQSREYAYKDKKQTWDRECASVRDSFMRKTSRVKTNKAGDVREYTSWYRVGADGYLTAAGKTEPDYDTFYPPEPVKPVFPEFEKLEGGSEYFQHVIISADDFKKFKKFFKKCWCFPVDSRL